MLHYTAVFIDIEQTISVSDKKAEYDVEVSGVDISPDPIARGQPATFSIAATTGTLWFNMFVMILVSFRFYYILVYVTVSIPSIWCSVLKVCY